MPDRPDRTDRPDLPERVDGTDDDLFFAGVAAQAAAVAEGQLSSQELVEAVLQRIQRLDGHLNAFTAVAADRALAEAAARDAQQDGRGPLHGVPIAIKEELDVAGEVTTFGGRANRTPRPADGEVVRRLRAAGAVIVGKTNMPEFGQWPFTESAAHGITRNPWDPGRSPGGSSGGSAAAVAAGLVPAAMGGDGGGSIRIPASFCGLFGLKPQRGRVTAAPAEHLWWALGTVGPLTRTVLDSALVYDAVRGDSPGDRFRAGDPGTPFADAVRARPRPLRIGVTTRPAIRGVRPDPEHVRAVRATADLLDSLGHRVEAADVGFPDTTTAFVPQFLGGVRAEVPLVERPGLLERRTRQALRAGFWATPRVVEWAMRQGEGVAAKVAPVFERYDVLLTPVTPHRPPEVGVLDGVGLVGAA